MANTLIALPSEILHNILKYVDPRDLGEVFMVCKQLYRFIGDVVLFKEVYWILLGEPMADFKPAKFDYKKELLSFCQARRAATNNLPVAQKRQDLLALSKYVSTACQISNPEASSSIEHMKEWFNDKGRGQHTQRDNTEAFLCQSNTFFRARHQDNPLSSLSFAERQASAKLHVYYGVPIFLPRTRRWDKTYPFAVSMVYDLRNYSNSTKWGPYLPDGQASVDWEKIEAVMLVLGHNMHAFTRQTHGMFPKVWSEPFEGITPNSYMDDGKYKKPKQEDMDAGTLWDVNSESVRRPIAKGLVDPYNVTGTWTRVVCFLDFHDLFAYNFTTGQPPTDEPRPPLNTTEAIRLIIMEIRATKSEAPGPQDGQEFPVIHFEGVSKSSMNTSWDPNANSTIRGTVRMTKEGEVRWQTFSVYAGEERWASEGIQIGGIRSARGVIGHWFDKDHDIHGPAGPTAFWKTSDGFREYEDDAQSPFHQNTASVEYEDPDEDDDEDGNEEVFELSGETASDLVTELQQLSGQTTAAQLHDVLTQMVMGHLTQHQNPHLHLHHGHDHDEEEDGEEREEEGKEEGEAGESSKRNGEPSKDEKGQDELELSNL